MLELFHCNGSWAVAATFATYLMLASGQAHSEELGAPIKLEPHSGIVSAVVFSPDGKQLLTGDGPFKMGRGRVRFWDVGTWKSRDEFFQHDNRVTGIAISPDGQFLASSSLAEFLRPPEIFLYNVKAGGGEPLPDDSVLACWDIVFSPDGKLLASAHESGHVKLWDVSNASLSATLEQHDEPITCLDFSPDGKVLASAGGGAPIRLWDVASRKQITFLHDDKAYVQSVKFFSDGKRLAAAGGKYDPETKTWTSSGISIWDLTTRKVAKTLVGHTKVARSVALQRQEMWLASASGVGIGKEGDLPGQLRFWNLADGAERVLIKLPAGISSLAVSPDGKFLAAGCDDAIARVWDVSRMGSAK